MQLEPALLRLRHVEARGQTDHDPGFELDHRDDEVRSLGSEGLAREKHPVGLDNRRVGGHPPRRAEDRGRDRERVDTDIDERADAVERPRIRVPTLDPAPVRLAVDDPHTTDRTVPDELPQRLLRLAEECRRRRAQANTSCACELDELPGLRVGECKRLLAVHVLTRLERCSAHLRVRLGLGQVDDGVDRRIVEERGKVGVDPSSVLGGECFGATGTDVGDAGELEPFVGGDPRRVAVSDVAAADDPDSHPSHRSSVARIARHSSLGS